jgi:cytochrome c oxidase assembly protein subunit 15
MRAAWTWSYQPGFGYINTMPFDLDTTRNQTETPRQAQNRHWVAGWLFVICGMLLVMIVLGGATRLTGSGLSIMEWDPIMGVLPPLSDAEWARLFKLYQAIPQYALINQGFGLAGFKHIFWLEWTHRLWGRLIGLAFAVPLVVFMVRGAIRRGLWLRLGAFLVLGGLQGAVGWFMVASGFAADSTAVSAYRLVMHLALALALYAAILWTGLSVLRPGPRRLATGPAFRTLLSASCVLVGLTIVAGGFVAGLHAGLLYNTFPLMGDGLVPPDYAVMHPFLRNLTENLAAVQFDHRVLATTTAALVLATVWTGLRAPLPRPLRRVVGVMVVAVLVQYTLGVLTLLWVVPVDLAVAHQATAVLLLTAALVALHLDRRSA